ncbi:MAG: FAD-binding oxidoreductase [Burkholderiaceae bacterium]
MSDSTKPQELARHLYGRILVGDSEHYEQARGVWNAMIDRHPLIIAQVASSEDIATTISFSQQHGLPLSVRGGGHHIAGTGVCDGGVTIDLSQLRGVQVDRNAKRAVVGGGALLQDLDRDTQACGMATTGGVVSTTGVGGLTLGGGVGWLARKHGLAIDNLLGVTLVTADGQIRTVSNEVEPELFWAVRGGGGNFGVAAAFEYQLHDLGHDIRFGPKLFDIDDASVVLQHYRDIAGDLDRDITIWADLLIAPDLPHIPASHRQKPVLSLLHCLVGTPDVAQASLEALRCEVEPVFNGVSTMPYAQAQQFLDATYDHGARNYWTTRSFANLSDEVIDTLVSLATQLPTAESDILVLQLGGAIDDVAVGDTAYPHRGVQFMVTPGARWRSAGDDARCIEWAKQAAQTLQPQSVSGRYANFVAEEGNASAGYGPNLPRLKKLKRQYDPHNVFQFNQNILPDL